jgi:hypothetical protein
MHQIRNVYNKEYPNSPIPNEVFKTKEYYNFMKDKWEDRKTGNCTIDYSRVKIKYDKPNMEFEFESDDGMLKAKYEDLSKIIIGEIKE